MRKFPALLAGAALTAFVLLPQPANAATGSHPRITTLIASSQYIVVLQQTSSKSLQPGDYAGGTVYATDTTGQRMTLPGFNNEHQALYMTGSIVAQAQNSIHVTTESQTIRWFDLNTRTGGTYTGMANEVLIGAGPDGWLMERSTDSDGVDGTPQRLTYVHRDGTRTDLGVPYPHGQSVQLAISDTGIVLSPGVSDENRFKTKVLYQPWSTIGASWRTIYTSKYDQVGVTCAPSTATVVACVRAPEEAEGEGPFTHGLISLSGAGVHWMSDSHPNACQRIDFATLNGSLVAIETSDAGVCTKGKLYRFSYGGDLVSGGSHHYSSTGIQTGLGGISGGRNRIVVSSLDQRHIDTLPGVTYSPHVLVRV